MHIVHIALGGCLKPKPVSYGVTSDTGGHIAYVLAAAEAQAKASISTRVTIVTRAFDDPKLGSTYGLEQQSINPQIEIARLRTAQTGYLSKENLVNELPALENSFLEFIDELPERPTICHAHFADAARLAIAARRQHGIPYLFTPHSLALDKARCTVNSDSSLEARMDRESSAINSADAIIVSSRDELNQQVAAYTEKSTRRVHVVPPGSTLADADETHEAEELLAPHLDRRNKPIILAIARPVTKKNLHALVKAYGESSALQRNANLVILAGQHQCILGRDDEEAKNLKELLRLRTLYRLEGRFALPAAHDHKTVAQLYRFAASMGGVFVNPAFHEPFGLTLLEAAQSGLPLVATQSGGPTDIIATLKAGTLIDPSNPSDIEEACLSYLSDEEFREETIRTAHSNLHSFSWKRWAECTSQIIAAVAQKRPKTSVCHAPSLESRIYAPVLLACDMDDTLTGSASAGRRFREWRTGVGGKDVHFVIATGREIDDARQTHATWGLPEPDVWITSVGSEIHRKQDNGELRECESYASLISHSWNRSAVEAELQKAGVKFQPNLNQRTYKISAFGDALEAVRVRMILESSSLAASVVASHGRFIDVLPLKAGKGVAVQFERQRLGIDVDHVVTAGNSGNDIDLLASANHAIMVANALPELTLSGPHNDLYRSPLPFADGVLDGVTRAIATLNKPIIVTPQEVLQ